MKYNPTLHKLSNGVTVILDPMDAETTSVKVFFRTGSRDETPSEYGLTHFSEHMLMKGTPHFPTRRYIDEYLAWHGGVINAATGTDHVCMYGRILGENTGVLVDVISDLLQNSSVDEKAVEIERNVVMDEYRRAQDSGQNRWASFVSDKLFNSATFSLRNLGTPETIRSFTRDQVLEFLGRRLSGKNCIIGISGKIADPQGLLEMLEKKFAFLPNRDVSENLSIKYTPAIVHDKISGNQNVRLNILFPDIHPVKFENIYASMSVGKFEKYMIENLRDIIRRQNGLVYGFGCADAGNPWCYLSGFGTETSAQNIGRVVELTAHYASQIYNDCKISAHDLERYWRVAQLGDRDFLDNSSHRCDKLINHYRMHDRLYDFNRVIEMDRCITPADVVKYSRGYFDGPMSIVTQGADFKDDLNAIWQNSFQKQR